MNQEFDLTDTDGEIMVKLARNAVKKYLETNIKVIDNEFNSKFTAKAGAFVTINKQNSLRGCIGYPLPIKKLSNVISVSGYSADVLPLTVFVNVLPFKSEFTVPLSAANRGFSIEKPVSSFIEPVRTTFIKEACPGKSALAPKLLY